MERYLKFFYITQILLLLTLSQKAAARTLHVGTQQQYKSLTAAVHAAKPGDTILVHKGIYREGRLIIDKTVALLGIGWPVLDGEGKTEVLSIKADGVLLKGFRVVNSGMAMLDDPAGIKVYDRSRVVIEGNRLENNFFGIYIQYGRHCAVRGNTVQANGEDEQQIGNGIHCWKSDSLLISGNSVSGHRDGIYFEFVTHSTIEANLSKGNVRYGLHFMFSNNDAYVSNTFSQNGAGVAVMFTNHVEMFNNTFESNWGDAAYGLLLKEISDSHIRGNTFRSNTTGIYMEGTNRIIFEKNTIASNGWGMKVQASCMDNEIRENNFFGNTFDISTNGELVLNKFDGNYWDKYEGYDLDRNAVGDVPYRPLSLFSVIVENYPSAMLLFRSFLTTLLDKSEKMIPSLTPDNFIDNFPRMRPYRL